VLVSYISPMLSPCWVTYYYTLKKNKNSAVGGSAKVEQNPTPYIT
jgi:hypothetical protein